MSTYCHSKRHNKSKSKRHNKSKSKSNSKRHNKSKSKRHSKRHSKSKKLFALGGANSNLGSDNFAAANCAPGHQDRAFSCYTDTALLKLRQLWNARHHDAASQIQTTVPYQIWQQLKKHMQSSCSSEVCWLKDHFADKIKDPEILKYTFAPESPKSWVKNPNEWLSSVEIERVMQQYEHQYPAFSFIGPSPIDFDTHLVNGECVWEDLCELSVASRLKAQKTKIGIIFNTDPHTKGGSHWISLFIDLQKQYMFFFDSNGTRAPKQIKALCDRISAQALALSPPLQITYAENAPLEHQYSNTECGMYSLFLIITLLTEPKTGVHRTYRDFMVKDKLVTDKHMAGLRQKLFNAAL